MCSFPYTYWWLTGSELGLCLLSLCLPGPETVTRPDEMVLFVQRWKPALHMFEPLKEVIVAGGANVAELKNKVRVISISGIG